MTLFKHFSKEIGDVSIYIEPDNKLSITTNELILTPFAQCEASFLMTQLHHLMSNPQNMQLFGSGAIWNRQTIQNYINTSLHQHQQNLAFCAFLVQKKTDNTCVGILKLDDASTLSNFSKGYYPNAVEISYIIDVSQRGQKFGTQLVYVAKKYLKTLNERSISDAPISHVMATVHTDNQASQKILRRALKTRDDQKIDLYGHARWIFFKGLDKPQQPSSATPSLNSHAFTSNNAC